MPLTKSELQALEDAGSRRLVQRLKRFRSDAKELLTRHPDLVERYPKQWVAIYEGKIKANGKSLSNVLRQLDQQQLPRADVLIGFLDKDGQALVL